MTTGSVEVRGSIPWSSTTFWLVWFLGTGRFIA
jgi:hypothetical protein